MPKRKVILRGITFRSAKDTQGPVGPLPTMVWAQAGEEVDVHEDDIERFDSLNVVPEPITSAEALEAQGRFEPEVRAKAEARLASAASVAAAEADGAYDEDETYDDPEESAKLAEEEADQQVIPRPKDNARLAEWQAYAEDQGIDTEGLTKREIIAEVDAEDDEQAALPEDEEV